MWAYQYFRLSPSPLITTKLPSSLAVVGALDDGAGHGRGQRGAAARRHVEAFVPAAAVARSAPKSPTGPRVPCGPRTGKK